MGARVWKQMDVTWRGLSCWWLLLLLELRLFEFDPASADFVDRLAQLFLQHFGIGHGLRLQRLGFDGFLALGQFESLLQLFLQIAQSRTAQLVDGLEDGRGVGYE